MSDSIIVLNSLQLQKKMLSLFSTSQNALIISPFINFSNIFNECNENIKIKIATNFSAEIFIKGSSDIDFFIKANERNYEIKHIDNLHSKIYLFDNCVIIGSSNLTYGGLKNNVETNLCILRESENFDAIKEDVLSIYNSSNKLVSKSDIEKMRTLKSHEEFTRAYLKQMVFGCKQNDGLIVRPSLMLYEVNAFSFEIFKKHEKIFELTVQIKDELEKSNFSFISFDSYKRLHKWCYQSDFSPYKYACEPTRQLCIKLFGYIIPERIRGVAFYSRTTNLYEKQCILQFHEEHLQF